MRNTGLEEAQAGIKIAGENINNLRYADDTTLMAESKEHLKNLLIKIERGEWKSWLQNQHSKNKDHDIWSYHFMADKWVNNGNIERFYLFIFGSKITEDGDYSHEIKRCFLFGRKAMNKLDSILKS